MRTLPEIAAMVKLLPYFRFDPCIKEKCEQAAAEIMKWHELLGDGIGEGIDLNEREST